MFTLSTLMFIIRNDNKGGNLKRLDFIKELRELGATFEEGGKHQKVYLNGKQTTIPRHNEIREFTAKAIRKQLGIM